MAQDIDIITEFCGDTEDIIYGDTFVPNETSFFIMTDTHTPMCLTKFSIEQQFHEFIAFVKIIGSGVNKTFIFTLPNPIKIIGNPFKLLRYTTFLLVPYTTFENPDLNVVIKQTVYKAHPIHRREALLYLRNHDIRPPPEFIPEPDDVYTTIQGLDYPYYMGSEIIEYNDTIFVERTQTSEIVFNIDNIFVEMLLQYYIDKGLIILFPGEGIDVPGEENSPLRQQILGKGRYRMLDYINGLLVDTYRPSAMGTFADEDNVDRNGILYLAHRFFDIQRIEDLVEVCVNVRSKQVNISNNMLGLLAHVNVLNLTIGQSRILSELDEINPISTMSILSTLSLTNTLVSDLKPLENLEYLTKIELIECPIEDLSPLQNLQRLADLTLISIPIIDLSPIQGLQNLTYLYLSGTRVSDISPLQGLQELRELSLSGEQIEDISPLQGLQKLAILYLNNNDKIENISPLQGLRELVNLYLDHTRISDISPLQGLKKLEILDLDFTQVRDLTPLQGLEKLTELSLNNTKVEDITPIWRYPNIKIVNLDNTPYKLNPPRPKESEDEDWTTEYAETSEY